VARAAPTILVGLHVLHVGWSRLKLPGLVETVARTLSRPFSNFLTLEDLLDPVDLQPRNPVLQQRLLALLSFAEIAIWTGYAGYAAYTAESSSILVYSLYLACWVKLLRCNTIHHLTLNDPGMHRSEPHPAASVNSPVLPCYFWACALARGAV
jgi:hypothetical protein